MLSRLWAVAEDAVLASLASAHSPRMRAVARSLQALFLAVTTKKEDLDTEKFVIAMERLAHGYVSGRQWPEGLLVGRLAPPPKARMNEGEHAAVLIKRVRLVLKFATPLKGESLQHAQARALHDAAVHTLPNLVPPSGYDLNEHLPGGTCAACKEIASRLEQLRRLSDEDVARVALAAFIDAKRARDVVSEGGKLLDRLSEKSSTGD